MAVSPPPPPISVRYADPTDRYAHGVLGDAIEYGAIEVLKGREVEHRVVLPETRVFEDIAPRIARLTVGGGFMVVMVESDLALGAQLAVYEFYDGEKLRKRAATPHIGQRNRWLAPAAIADFDGDGVNDITYVETPHLAGILKIVTLRDDDLMPVAEPQPGFSNHRIGENFITSGTRDCGNGVELLLPDLGWTILMAARLEDGAIVSRPLSHPPSREGIEAAQRCA